MQQFSSINFLRERNRLQEAVVVGDRKLSLISTVLLGVMIASTFGVFSYRFYLSQKKAALEEGTQQAAAQLLALKDVQEEAGRRKTLLDTIKTIIANRGKSWEAIEYTYSILPADTQIQSITLASGTSLEFAVAAKDIFTYKELSTVLQSPALKENGYSLSLGTLSRAKDGEYTLNVNLAIIDPNRTVAAPEATPVSQDIDQTTL